MSIDDCFLDLLGVGEEPILIERWIFVPPLSVTLCARQFFSERGEKATGLDGGYKIICWFCYLFDVRKSDDVQVQGVIVRPSVHSSGVCPSSGIRKMTVEHV